MKVNERKTLDLFQINFVANKKVILHILSTNFCDTTLPFGFPIFLLQALLALFNLGYGNTQNSHDSENYYMGRLRSS